MSVQFIVAALSGGTVAQGYLIGKSRGATVLMAGNTATGGPVTQSLNGSILGKTRQANPKAPDPAVVSTLSGRHAPTSRTVRALGAGLGDWGVVRAGAYVVLGGNITTLLANYTAYRGLAGGASDTSQRVSIHRRRASNAATLATWNWDLAYSGKTYPTLSTTFTTTATDNLAATGGTTTLATDVAATASRAIPGHLCFTVNGKKAIITNYLAKTN